MNKRNAGKKQTKTRTTRAERQKRRKSLILAKKGELPWCLC